MEREKRNWKEEYALRTGCKAISPLNGYAYIDYVTWLESQLSASVVQPDVLDAAAAEKTASEFTANDIDGAYFLGVFNASGIDGLANELKRIKDLGMMPHTFVHLFERAATK